jgi:hypothetical protein
MTGPVSENTILNLVPKMLSKFPKTKALRPAFLVAAAAFTKKGNLLGIEMNRWRNLQTTRRGTSLHAEAALIRKYGKRIDTIYILRAGNSGDILPVHPCEDCANMAAKVGIRIIPIHELLGFY